MPFTDMERELLNKASDYRNFNKSDNEFRLLFVNYAKNIISKQFCWNHDLEPEDLVQETIIKALSNEDKYQAGSNLKNWVYTLMLNIHRDYKRKNNFEFSVEEEDLINLIDISDDKKINNKTIFFENNQKKEEEEKIKIIYSVMKDLPQVEREIYISIYVNDFNSRQVAEMMKMPAATVRTILARTNKKVRDLVNKKLN